MVGYQLTPLRRGAIHLRGLGRRHLDTINDLDPDDGSLIRAARRGVNPATGEPIVTAASGSPAFKAGKALRDAVNR